MHESFKRVLEGLECMAWIEVFIKGIKCAKRGASVQRVNKWTYEIQEIQASMDGIKYIIAGLRAQRRIQNLLILFFLSVGYIFKTRTVKAAL